MKTQDKLKNLQELKAKEANLAAMHTLLAEKIISDGKAILSNYPRPSLFKPEDPLKAIKINGKINIPGKVFSYLLPLLVTKVLFRRSGFVTKAIVAIVARQTGKRIGNRVFHWAAGMICFYLSRKEKVRYSR